MVSGAFKAKRGKRALARVSDRVTGKEAKALADAIKKAEKEKKP